MLRHAHVKQFDVSLDSNRSQRWEPQSLRHLNISQKSSTRTVSRQLQHCHGHSTKSQHQPDPSSRNVCRAAMSNGNSSDAELANCPEEFVQLGNRLADAAAQITTKYFRTRVGIDSKSDESPVTVADREAEAAMRKILGEEVPDHCIFGEEQGMQADGAGSGYLWVLDPIDGTRSFITGNPLFGTLISLLHNGKPILGIIDSPILKERWLGASGRTTTLNGTDIHVRECEDLREAYMYSTSPHIFPGASEKAWARVRDQVLRPLYGGDCYSYGLLASGHTDLVVEASMGPYDYMAHVPIIKGAGGFITNWEGEELGWPMTPSNAYALQDLPGEIIAAGDKRTLQQALELLKWAETKDDAPEESNIDVTFRS